MNSDKMKFRQEFEGYVIYIVAGLTILIFAIAPTHADGSISIYINNFLDNFLFGNGYYKPTAYPFAAKMTNSLSVVFSAIAGIWVGAVRRHDVLTTPGKLLKFVILFWIINLFMLWTSMYPQQFSINPPRRSFGLTESFHNNPFLFIMLMVIKNAMIYCGFRSLTTLIFFSFKYYKETE